MHKHIGKEDKTSLPLSLPRRSAIWNDLSIHYLLIFCLMNKHSSKDLLCKDSITINDSHYIHARYHTCILDFLAKTIT